MKQWRVNVRFLIPSNELVHTMVQAAWLLGIFGAVGTAALVLTYTMTKERIEINARVPLMRSLQQVVSNDRYDNEITTDTLEVYDSSLRSSGPVTVYRARKGGAPAAVVFTAVASDGYGGNIKLLIGINVDGTISGVRVISHKETPGLGDKIEIDRSPWITKFSGRSLRDPETEDWAVKKDGGTFDQFSGATITPRAVVSAIKRALQYYEIHRNMLFSPLPLLRP